MLNFIRSRLQVKLISVFLVVLVVSGTVVSQIFASFSTSLLIDEEQASESSLVRSQLQVVESRLAEIKDDVINLSLAPDSRLLIESMVSRPGSAIVANFEDSIALFLEEHPAYGTITMLDGNGLELARVGNSESGQQAAGEDALTDQSASTYFTETWILQAGEVYVNGPESSSRGAEIRYSTPVVAATGDFVGVLSLTASFQLVTDPFLTEQRLATITILDSDGNYLLNSEESPPPASSFIQDRPQDARIILSEPSGSLVQSENRPNALQSFQQIPFRASNVFVLTVVREKQMGALIERINSVRASTFLVFGVAVVALAVIMWFVTRVFVRPLRQLEISATEISRGNFNVDLPAVRTSDELGELARAFAAMSHELDALIGSLERRVEERTGELQAATEQLEVALQKAVETDQIKSQFLASMSHELRTPLNSILTFSDLMAMGTFGEVNDEQADYLHKILFSGRHLLALINDVLDISKMESGMMKLFVEENFDAAKEIDNVRATADKMIGDKPVTLVVDVDREIPPLAVDQRRVRQVLLNILSNAVKFTEEGTITLSAKKKEAQVLFAIIDTGPGIREDQHELIFEPFVQTEMGIRHAGGTGLGLPISKRLVEAHGGRLWLESTPGQGAAFFFTLPLEPMVQPGEVALQPQ